jgi:hypothetical protein
VSLLAGDNVVSNVPTFFNLAKYTAGTARITTNLAVTGTLEFQSGANLDAGGNSVVLSNAGLVVGQAYNATVTTNSAPLTYGRGGTNVTGNAWPFPRWGGQ